jgi:hypothetical protein
MAGYFSTTTDPEGRFALPEIAPGGLSLAVIPPGETDLLPDLTKLPPAREGRENTLELPLRRAATVTGLIREHGNGAPIAGMRVHLFRPGGSGGVDAVTDAQGRYTYLSLAGKASVWAPETPPDYARSPTLNPTTSSCRKHRDVSTWGPSS